MNRKLSFGDKVKIKELNTMGIIISILIEFRGTTYNVRYFMNGESKEVNFFHWEIEKVDDTKQT